MEFFSSMDTYLQGFWFIAIPVSIIFVIQTVMTFVGANASDGLAADFDGDFLGEDAPFQLFSLRNLWISYWDSAGQAFLFMSW